MCLIFVALLQSVSLPPTALSRENSSKDPTVIESMPTEAEFTSLRQTMVKSVMNEARKTGFDDDSILKPVMSAIRQTPRHLFVPKNERGNAYKNIPLPIGYDQTISDPYIVAVMTYMLDLKPTDSVLEIGTGSGYQAAILSQLTRSVHTIEIVKPLANEAAERLKLLGYRNVKVRAGDGYSGWADAAPFDAVIVTAGATHLPPALLDQLKPGGRMIIPLGPNWAQEQLTLIKKDSIGNITKTNLGWVIFVDFTGEMKIARPKAP